MADPPTSPQRDPSNIPLPPTPHQNQTTNTPQLSAPPSFRPVTSIASPVTTSGTTSGTSSVQPTAPMPPADVAMVDARPSFDFRARMCSGCDSLHLLSSFPESHGEPGDRCEGCIASKDDGATAAVQLCMGPCATSKPATDFHAGYQLCRPCRKVTEKQARLDAKAALEVAEPKTCTGPFAKSKPAKDFAVGHDVCKGCRNVTEKQARLDAKAALEVAELKTCAGPCAKSKPAAEFNIGSNKCKECQAVSDKQRRGAAGRTGWQGPDFHVPIAGIARYAAVCAGALDPASDATLRYGNNHWFKTRAELCTELAPFLADRPVTSSSLAKDWLRDDLLTLLLLQEGKEGKLPVPIPIPSAYHGMGHQALYMRATSIGRTWSPRAKSDQPAAPAVVPQAIQLPGDDAPPEFDHEMMAKRESAISFLLANDHRTNTSYWKGVDRSSVRGKSLVDTLARIDHHQLRSGYFTARAPQQEVNNQAHRNYEGMDELEQISSGEVEGMTGQDAVLKALEPVVTYDLFCPIATSSRELLTGAHALAESLHSMRVRDWRSCGAERQRPINTGAGLDHPDHSRITPDHMMRLLFEDWDANQVYDQDAPGKPTVAFEQYASRLFKDFTAEEAAQEAPHLYHMVDLNAFQLDAILSILYETSHVVGEMLNEVEVPPHVEVTRDYDPNDLRPALFVHNNLVIGGGFYTHWEGMGEGGDFHALLSWGFPIIDADEMPHMSFRATLRHANETVEERTRRENRNKMTLAALRDRQSRKSCVQCRDDNLRCTGDVKKGPPCKQCASTGKGKQCKWLAHQQPPSQAAPGEIPTDAHLRPWNTQYPGDIWANTESLIDFETEPEAEKYYAAFFFGRHSSHAGDDEMQQTLRRLRLTRHLYRTMHQAHAVMGEPINHFPEGTPPAAGGVMIGHCVAFARHGTMAVPTSEHNLNNEQLKAFVHELHHYFAYNQPPGNALLNRPTEIHFVINGLAGLSVGIRHWGSRIPGDGLFAFMLQQDAAHGTNMADHVYVVVHSEERVIDGVGNFTLAQGRTPGWQMHKHRALKKHKLADLIDRETYLRACHLLNVQLVAQGQPHAPPGPMQFTANEARDMDTLIPAFEDEARWRTANLGPGTNPTAQAVKQRNLDRNKGLRNQF